MVQDVANGSLLAEFWGGLPNNWNWGLYNEGTQDLVLDENGDPFVGVNLIEPGDIYIDGLGSGSYRLDIYDINGRLIDTIFDKGFSAGVYEAQWEASGYPSGIYFAKITSQDISITKKLVLMK